MENENDNKKRNSDKSQTMFMIGVALFVIGLSLFFIGYSQPRIYVNSIEEMSNNEQVIYDENSTINKKSYNQSENMYNQNSNVKNTNSNTNNNVKVKTNKVNNDATVINYPLNINTATYNELVSIDGIGDSKANLIINYRNEIGPFESLDELKNIKGFGDATVEKLSQFLTV